MKLLDDRKRLFGIVNPVDFVAILLAIAAVVLLASVLFGKSPTAPVTGGDGGTVEVVLLGSVTDCDELQYELGQEVSRLGGTGVMGTLEKVDITPARREVFREDGSTVMAESTTFVDVRMVVRGKGEITEDGASIGDQLIRQNQVFDAQLPHLQVSVRVISITQVD